ncbi:senescence-specific cysteine protease SAG39-like [Helicoverpa zea]|uniref:senescence-specific cysteine protease SAG39-like n=1 Tax=Helicoverpa zea TaxID=7113 RepID=UPI000B36DCD2|nr:senescence-specific cysteine protease SAG39-like [Helicoverpa zea]PZC86477.1 hypothetical protein B5X24_HaOG209196 [Helicoverpa armigera]
MRSVSIVLMLVLVAMASSTPAGDKPHYDVQNAHVYFEQFIKDNNRVYKDDADREAHFRAFVDSLVKINKLNAESDSATYGINKFADYTEEERKNMFGFKRP